MSAAVLVALLAAALPSVDVAVLPVAGDAEARDRARAGQALLDALRAIEGVRVLALDGLAGLLGPEASAALDRCEDDPCFRHATRAIRADGLLVPRLERGARGGVLRLRLVETSTGGEVVATRVTRDVAEGGLITAVVDAVSELLPERVKRSSGRLVLAGALPPGAELEVDGHALGPVPEEASSRRALQLPPGLHAVAVRAPGHAPFAGTAEIALGQTTELAPQLSKRRSRAPWILGGIGVGAAGLGALLGARASGTAGDWADACGSGVCASGFTRARYAQDRSNVDRERVSANALFVVSAAALVSGLIWYLVDPGVDAP